MKYLIISILLFSSIAISVLAVNYGDRNPDVLDASLVKLLCFPGQFNGKHVRVVGVVEWDREGSYLFLSSDHANAYDTMSAIELPCGKAFLPADIKELIKLNGHVVAIEGEFSKDGGLLNGPCFTRLNRVYDRRISEESLKGISIPLGRE